MTSAIRLATTFLFLAVGTVAWDSITQVNVFSRFPSEVKDYSQDTYIHVENSSDDMIVAVENVSTGKVIQHAYILARTRMTSNTFQWVRTCANTCGRTSERENVSMNRTQSSGPSPRMNMGGTSSRCWRPCTATSPQRALTRRTSSTINPTSNLMYSKKKWPVSKF